MPLIRWARREETQYFPFRTIKPGMQAFHTDLPVGRSIHLRRLKHPLDENPCWEILGRIVVRLCAVLLSLPLLLVLVVLLPLCVVARWFLLFVHWNTQRSRYQGKLLAYYLCVLPLLLVLVVLVPLYVVARWFLLFVH
ncbi:hypothetical protein M8J77_001662 [Diaphorina citri]|nr:hypothetical protein M8J77_001662 [Diaphorina citri]